MKLNKKHIGQLFDNSGDGSWCYQLVAIKGKELLFHVINTSRYEIDTNRYADWKRFTPRKLWPKDWVKRGWEQGRRDR